MDIMYACIIIIIIIIIIVVVVIIIIIIIIIINCNAYKNLLEQRIASKIFGFLRKLWNKIHKNIKWNP
jgi:hypothetical protein